MEDGVDNKVKKELFYDSIADDWPSFMNQYDLRQRLHIFSSELFKQGELEGKTVLDAGCGLGYFSKMALERGALVTSLDISEKLVEKVRKEINPNAIVGSVLELPFDTDYFDVVISSEVIEHTPSPRTAVHEMCRVIKPGGLLVLSCPNRFWFFSLVIANLFNLRRYQGLENWPSWGQLKNWVLQCDMEIEQMRGIHLFPMVVPMLNPLLRHLDRFGRILGRLYVNQAVRARKLPHASE